jgi:hypothetical protein
LEVSEARRRIRVQAGFELDAEMLGLIGRLRPYRGLDERDFAELVQALITLHPVVFNAPAVERDLVAALWSLCQSTCTIGIDPKGLVVRNGLATASDVRALERWIDSIESFSTRMLRGIELSQCASHVLEYIASPELRSPQHFAFLLPILKNVAECDDADVSEMALRAIELLRK